MRVSVSGFAVIRPYDDEGHQICGLTRSRRGNSPRSSTSEEKGGDKDHPVTEQIPGEAERTSSESSSLENTRSKSGVTTFRSQTILRLFVLHTSHDHKFILPTRVLGTTRLSRVFRIAPAAKTGVATVILQMCGEVVDPAPEPLSDACDHRLLHLFSYLGGNM